jgi:hypothetical protein
MSTRVQIESDPLICARALLHRTIIKRLSMQGSEGLCIRIARRRLDALYGREVDGIPSNVSFDYASFAWKTITIVDTHIYPERAKHTQTDANGRK